MSEPIQDGVVKWFSAEKGYGYIVGEDKTDRHFRVKDVIGANLPRTGQQVHFVPIQRTKGVAASSVTLIDDSNNTAPGDGRVICMSCNNRVSPRIVTYRGQPERSLCPVCGHSLKEFNEPAIEVIWRELSLLLLRIGSFIEKQVCKRFR
ncbi:cold-shock protein [Candidatus Ferrigenium straubiae]|jgi:CspA family cold shock protein|uniref:cold-shock protein n=1 Tax=Candidatus Ferrigenium straubiae TaxID=2919506 RepID=UPI003F4AA03E